MVNENVLTRDPNGFQHIGDAPRFKIASLVLYVVFLNRYDGTNFEYGRIPSIKGRMNITCSLLTPPSTYLR